MLKIESSKHLLWEVQAKLVEGQYVFLIQPKTLDNEKNVNKGNKERDNPKHGAQETIIKLIYSL